ncbi:MAG: RodZ domain-containing protein [Pseudomonadota bacterium]
MSEAFQSGFGARLKAGREAKGLAVAEVAAKLKLTGRQVEALEAEDLSHLPSPVFVRGFVRNYARLVDVEPDSLIAPVDAQATVSETITAPSAGVRFASSGLRRWVVLPLAAFAVFLVLVAVLYHWLRQGEDSLLPSEPAAEVPALPAPAPTQTVPLAPATQLVPDGSPADAAPAPTPLTGPAGTLPASAGQPAPPGTLPVPNLPPPQAATQPVSDKPVAEKPADKPVEKTAEKPAKPAGHALRFEPSQDAWIQVVDGKGNRFSKLVRTGTVETFSGDPPFRLVVGEAAKVRMSYDGHVIDLTPFIGQKVARLTLE